MRKPNTSLTGAMEAPFVRYVPHVAAPRWPDRSPAQWHRILSNTGGQSGPKLPGIATLTIRFLERRNS